MPELELRFRPARATDLATIVGLLADDRLGARRESATDPLPASYSAAFEAITTDANQELVVAEVDGAVIGVLQLTFIPGITYRGGWRAQVEGVRVDEKARLKGIGRAMFEWAIERARERRCRLVQLTTDAQRPEALAFYESLGFTATHHGLKLHLQPPDA